MSFASMPIYTGDYLRDTRHLTPLKHGIYLLFLMACWDSKGPLPLDEQECAGIANCRSADEIEALRYVLDRFFVRMDDGHYNKRMAEEIAKAEALSAKNRENGLKSAEARREKVRNEIAKRRGEQAEKMLERSLNDRSTSVEGASAPNPNLNPNLSLVPNPKEKTKSGNEAARRILAFLNEKTGRRYQPVKANLSMIEARLKDGATETELRQVVAKKCREWAGDEKMSLYLRPATLFNSTKFAQYQGELVTTGDGNG